MRKLIWISGDKSWCNLLTKALINTLPKDTQRIIFCGSDPQTLSKQQINIQTSSKRGTIEHYLGTQCSVLIVNCFNGFNPELFCALCGTVQSPGIIILTTPASVDWPSYPDPDSSKLCSFPYSIKDIKGRFIRYFINKLKSRDESQSIISLSEHACSDEFVERTLTQVSRFFSDTDPDKAKPFIHSDQQKQVVNEVKNIINSDTSTVLILSGKRGRGKSSILGIALNAYATNFCKKVTVCVVSQSKSNIQALIKQLYQQEIQIPHNKLKYQSLSLSCCPPDEILKEKQNVDLLIVDEAAAIPLPQLYRMLETYQKIILSTTTDGYEGTGMGFTSKLQQRLSAHQKSVMHIQLTQAFRWPDNDPIEIFLNKSLLLDKTRIATVADTSIKMKVGDFKFKKLDRDDLIADTDAIDQIYALLSSAHYRTTPDDLRYMLDAPQIEIWVAHRNKIIYAAMMVAPEGGLPENLQEDIWLGIRRLRGHLSPQCISAQCGFKSASTFHFKRILRIAVYKPYRKIGIGNHLVNMALKSDEVNTALDYYSVSFGYEDSLFEFWRTLGFFAVKLGFRRNARSGEKSVMMLKPASDRAFKLLTSLHARFYNEIEFESSRRTATNQSSYERIYTSTQRFSSNEIHNSSQDRLDVYSFAFGHRQMAHCYWVLSKYTNLSLNTNIRDLLSADQIKLLTLKILQNKDWKTCSDLLAYTGKKEIMTNLRQIFVIIYSATWGNKS